MAIYSNGKKLDQFKFRLEADFEREIVANSKTFFGKNTIYLDTKQKIKTQSLVFFLRRKNQTNDYKYYIWDGTDTWTVMVAN